MAVDYSLPNWLIPKGFDAQLERMASLQAMEMGAREQQQKREFALRTDQFRLQQQKANLDMAGQVMSNQMMSDEMEDQHAIQSVLPQWQQGNFDVSPEGLKTIKGMAAAERLKTGIMSQNTLGQARIAMDKDATAVIEDDPYNAAMLSQFKPYSAEYAKQLKIMVDTMKTKKEELAARTFKMKEEFIGQRQAEIADIRAQSAMDIAALRVQGMVDLANARGYKLKLSDLDAIKARGLVHDLGLIEKEIDVEKARGGWKLFGGGPRSDVQKHLEERKDEINKQLQSMQLNPSYLAPSTSTSTPQIKTDEDFDRLPSGSHFIDPTGQERVKP